MDEGGAALHAASGHNIHRDERRGHPGDSEGGGNDAGSDFGPPTFIRRLSHTISLPLH
jgi:hypothetical protein